MVKPRGETGAVMVELTMAMGILCAVVLPLAFSFTHEQRSARAYYYRAVAMEIVDGEMESLAAGEWRAFGEGTHDYPARAESARNLPAGRFVLDRHGKRLRLEWRPAKARDGGAVVREVTLP